MSGKIYQFWYLILADVVHSLLVVGFAYKYKLIQKAYSGESVLAFAGTKRSE